MLFQGCETLTKPSDICDQDRQFSVDFTSIIGTNEKLVDKSVTTATDTIFIDEERKIELSLFCFRQLLKSALATTLINKSSTLNACINLLPQMLIVINLNTNYKFFETRVLQEKKKQNLLQTNVNFLFALIHHVAVQRKFFFSFKLFLKFLFSLEKQKKCQITNGSRYYFFLDYFTNVFLLRRFVFINSPNCSSQK